MNDVKTLKEASDHHDAMVLFIEHIRDKWSGDVLAKANNTEFVSTQVALLRQEAEDLLESSCGGPDSRVGGKGPLHHL